MTQCEVLKTNEPDRWKEVLEEVGSYDYYHLPQFHKLTEIRGYGEAVMPVFRERGYTMAYPLLIRPTDVPPFLGAEQGYKDAASAPGIIGPIVSAPVVPEDVRQALMGQFHEYLRGEKVITVFGRLNYLIDYQKGFLNGWGEIRDEGWAVSIDLTRPAERQFSGYRSNHRRQIKKLRSQGFTVAEVGVECLDKWLDIYYDTMDKVHATQHWYYPKWYFEHLLTEIGDAVHLFACKDGDTIACMAVYCVCNGVIHYIYGGTVAEYRSQSPSKLLTDEIRLWGVRMGAHTFHLGGDSKGRSGQLHQHKMGFGGREQIFSVWRYVADPEAYDYLCRKVCEHSDTEPDDSYFPLYRNPNLHLTAATDT